MPTYLADILASHRARAAADRRPLADLVERGGERAATARLRRRTARRRALVHRRDQASFPVQGRPRPRAAARPGGQGVRRRRCRLPVGADRRRLLRRVTRRPGGGPRRPRALPVLRKDFTVQRGRRGRRAAHGRRRRPPDRRRPRRRRAARAAPPWPSIWAWPPSSRCTTRRSSTAPWPQGRALVGVNQRDLRTFGVDHERACALAARIPPGVVAVAESGIRDAADARRLAEAGYDAILVGETLVRAGDRVAQLQELVGHPVGAR